MRFNLELGDTACDGGSKFATVKINNEEKINLPTKSYYYFYSNSSPYYQYFKVHDFSGAEYTISIHPFDRLQLKLKLERIKDNYKLVLTDGSGFPYYCYYELTNGIVHDNKVCGNIYSVPGHIKNNTHIHALDAASCSLKFIPLEDSRILIDPKDIISGKNINLILEDLKKSHDKMLKIQIGEKFLEKLQLIAFSEHIFPDHSISRTDNYKKIYKSVKVLDFAGNKIGILNNVVPYFHQTSSSFQLFPFDEEFENSYFATEKLGDNYVGCISDENGECKNSYRLNPDSFGYKYDHDLDLYLYGHSLGLYPYYYNLENFGNFLEVDVVNFREFMDLEERVKSLRNEVSSLQSRMSGPPGQDGAPGHKGEPGLDGSPGSSGYGYSSQKGEPGSNAKPEDVAAILLSSEVERFKEALFNTPITELKGKTLYEYIIQDMLKDVASDKKFRESIKGEKGEQGLKGEVGPKGLGGEKGDVGKPGIQGLKGERGKIGTPARPGIKGEEGEIGLPGFPGRDSAQGPKGDRGFSGPSGPKGLGGEKGNKGDYGEPGPAGPRGERGESGTPGTKGDKGDAPSATEIATELVISQKAKLGEAVLDAKDSSSKNLVTQVASTVVNLSPQDFVNKVDATKFTEGVVHKLSEKEAKNIVKDTVDKITSDATQQNNPDPSAFKKYEKFAEKLAELLVDRSNISNTDANTLVKNKVSDWGLAKYLLLYSDLKEQAKARHMVKQEIDKEKLVEYLLEYTKLRGDVDQAKTIVEGIVNNFLNTKVDELGKAVLEAKDDQDKKILVNDPALQKGVAEELRKNPGQIKGENGAQGVPGLQGPKGDTGPVGPKGVNGTQGLPGEKGLQGIKGDRGKIGTPGTAGLKGGTGPQGEKGNVGLKGNRGETGASGVVGLPGAKGDKGPQGPKGDTGAQGIQGFNGMKGDKGNVGSPGTPRAKGDRGDVGPQGVDGAPGTDGAPGVSGEKGQAGTKGDKGIQGPQGLVGPRGADGLLGMPGPKGDQGINGAPGPKGDMGDKGNAGVQGIPGSKGNQGNVGPRGPQGNKGDQGIQGPQGFNGTQGDKGSQGLKGDKGEFGIVEAPGQPGLDGLPGEKGNKGDIGPKGLIGDKGEPGIQGLKGERGNVGLSGVKGDQGPRGFNGTQGVQGEKGDLGPQGLKGDQGDMGAKGVDRLPGAKGDTGPVGPQGVDGAPGFIGPQGLSGLQGQKGELGVDGLKGDTGPKGDKGDLGPIGPKGPRGDQGFKGQIGRSGPQGLVGPKGNTGAPGLQGPKGEDGVSAAVADQFLLKMNQTKLEIQDAQKAAEVAKTASEKSAKEAQDAEGKVTKLHTEVMDLTKKAETLSNAAKRFAVETSKSKSNVEAFYGQIQDMFCEIKPTDQVCTAPRGKREAERKKYFNDQPATSGASRPTSFISQVINFFYPYVGQDEYKIENKIQEVAKVMDAADIAIKFEKVLEETASNCGIPKKSLNFDPGKLESTIIRKSLFNGENRNELLKLLCAVAKKSCPNYKQTDKCLATFKDRMERTLENNEQQRASFNNKKTATDNGQPRSFMSDIIPPSSLNAINQGAVGYLR